jgi:hypothetical protein
MASNISGNRSTWWAGLPYQDGKWYIVTCLIDPKSKRASAYNVYLSSKEDKKPIYLIKGVVKSSKCLFRVAKLC